MAASRNEVLRAIRRVGQRGAHFQSREIRERLEIDTSNRNAAARLYNAMKSLMRDGVIEELPGERKRNKYFRITDEEKLRQMVGAPHRSAGNGSRPSSAPADRLARIEMLLANMDERLGHLDARVDELVDMWS